MTHPLHGFSISLHNIKCFGSEGSGYFEFSPITLVIGRNNSGKSSIVDFLESATASRGNAFSNKLQRSIKEVPNVQIRRIESQENIYRAFSHVSIRDEGYRISGNDFAEKHLIGKELAWVMDGAGQVRFLNERKIPSANDDEVRRRLISLFSLPMKSKLLIRVAAERNILPEAADPSRAVQPDGRGLTNLVRAYINSSDLDRDVVEIELLRDLNEIYAGDAKFTRVSVQEDEADHNWEVYVREEEKGDIRLSQSGSALKTILSILAPTRLNKHRGAKELDENSILCIEELENNLHPGLLRRTLEYLAADRKKKGYSLVLTTHSPVCIDWSSRREDCTIIHVTHNNGVSTCRNALTHLSKIGALDDLDVRGSDILQSNGIIWIEGPSDRIYIRRWIDILSKGSLKEGVHYTFMFYGGRILSHFAAAEEQEATERISMITANRNVAIVMDSDVKSPENLGKINKTKRRLLDEVALVNGFGWVTAGKEIENYVHEEVWIAVAGKKVRVADPNVNIPSIASLREKHRDKVSLAEAAATHLKSETMHWVLDLETRVSELCERIRKWNALV